MRSVAEFILGRLAIRAVIVHPRHYAVMATEDGTSQAIGPRVGKPVISTGGGDHFNAGVCLGKLIGADNELALQLGVGASGYYVKMGKSPNSNELADFLHTL